MKRTLGVLVVIAAALFISTSSLFAGGSDWTTDFEKAKKTAKEKNLLILADFSGSDWCGWCKKLDAEVFSKAEFLGFAKKNFVLVMVDFPRMKQLPSNVMKQNNALQAKYKIEGYPTVIIMNAVGKELDRTGYQPGGASNYVKYLEGVLKKNKK
ncbi:MAG: hypothetical protein A2020_01965 [Lentisphaerae bacterium GWF2_45_14]|nr:MAG: hypothetical protein A2020_01965 [Lentisphaerae bacterium GWF2_45_14]